MKNLSTPYLAAEVVAKAVLTHLWSQGAGATSSLRLASSPSLLHKLWSTLYFLPVSNLGEPYKLVAKIAHFPDQSTPELSWQSEELLIRGRREFETMARVSDHFACQPDSLLSALHPRGYLPDINAVVMDFVSGRTLFEECFTGRGILTGQGRRRAQQLMERIGHWLRWFHHLPLENIPAKRVFGPSDTFEALGAAVDKLCALGVNPAAWPRWGETLALLSQVDHEELVWTHGDFHLRNVFVVFPGDKVLGLDTALERVDSPYFDLGKFIADLKTRRGVILGGGLLPPPQITHALIRAFLSGYLGQEQLAVLPLALYEGRFILEKWVQSLTVIRETFGGRATPAGAAVSTLIINPTFRRIINRWLRTVNAAVDHRTDLYRMQEIVCEKVR